MTTRHLGRAHRDDAEQLRHPLRRVQQRKGRVVRPGWQPRLLVRPLLVAPRRRRRVLAQERQLVPHPKLRPPYYDPSERRLRGWQVRERCIVQQLPGRALGRPNRSHEVAGESESFATAVPRYQYCRASSAQSRPLARTAVFDCLAPRPFHGLSAAWVALRSRGSASPPALPGAAHTRAHSLSCLSRPPPLADANRIASCAPPASTETTPAAPVRTRRAQTRARRATTAPLAQRPALARRARPASTTPTRASLRRATA